jgi:adenine/guanine phosphoribosyltransferase-like PRPP-binding protein
VKLRQGVYLFWRLLHDGTRIARFGSVRGVTMSTHADLFRDRRDAGRRIADRLGEYADRRDVVVLGLPRGGIPVAFEVSQALAAPLDVFVVR